MPKQPSHSSHAESFISSQAQAAVLKAAILWPCFMTWMTIPIPYPDRLKFNLGSWLARDLVSPAMSFCMIFWKPCSVISSHDPVGRRARTKSSNQGHPPTNCACYSVSFNTHLTVLPSESWAYRERERQLCNILYSNILFTCAINSWQVM